MPPAKKRNVADLTRRNLRKTRRDDAEMRRDLAELRAGLISVVEFLRELPWLSAHPRMVQQSVARLRAAVGRKRR